MFWSADCTHETENEDQSWAHELAKMMYWKFLSGWFLLPPRNIEIFRGVEYVCLGWQSLIAYSFSTFFGPSYTGSVPIYRQVTSQWQSPFTRGCLTIYSQLVDFSIAARDIQLSRSYTHWLKMKCDHDSIFESQFKDHKAIL